MKKIGLLLFAVFIVGGVASGEDVKPLTATELAGIYDLAKFTYRAEGGTPEVVSPPDILSTLELTASGEFRQTVSYKGKSLANASGPFSVSDSMITLVNTPTGSRMKGTVSDDGRKLSIPIVSGGATAEYEYIKQ